MGHWAKVVTSHVGIGTSAEDNTVVKVIVADASFFDTYEDPEGPGRWVETKKGMAGGILWNPDGTQVLDQSGVGTMGYNYAGTGMLYDVEKHAFYEKKPFPSYTLNQTTFLWDPPIPYPSSGDWKWDEEAYQADNTKGWVVEP